MLDVGPFFSVVKPNAIWGETTCPISHDATDYRYLVHSFNSFSSLGKLSFHSQRSYDHSDDVGDQSINLFDEPERVGERVSLSMSLIDQDHRATFGDSGLIVEVPSDNIIANDTSDMGVINAEAKTLRSRFKNAEIVPPSKLLYETSSDLYNEVLAWADNNGRKIRLVGFFYNVGRSGKPFNEDIARHMIRHAVRLGLPIVEIKKPETFGSGKIFDEEGRLIVTLDGNSFRLKGNEKDFWFYDEETRIFFMSPEQIEKVFSFMRLNGYDEQTISALQAGYANAHNEYYRARFSFHDGKVTGITKFEGYGRDRVVISINQYGELSVRNPFQDIVNFERSLLSNQQGNYAYRSSSHGWLNFPQAVKIIQEAVSNTEGEESVLAQTWVKDTMPKIRRNLKPSLAQYLQAHI